MSALDRLEEAVQANAVRAEMIKARIAYIREQRAAGRTWTEIVQGESPPLIVQLVSDSAMALDEDGVRLRRVEALALYNEGMTMEQIAAHFGVTRQRVSTLLKASTG